jgi:hypothetical protein
MKFHFVGEEPVGTRSGIQDETGLKYPQAERLPGAACQSTIRG